MSMKINRMKKILIITILITFIQISHIWATAIYIDDHFIDKINKLAENKNYEKISELLKTENSIQRIQLLLTSKPVKKKEQKLNKIFFKKIKKFNNLGIPLYVKTYINNDTFLKDEVLIIRGFTHNCKTIELSGNIDNSIFKNNLINKFEKTKLIFNYYRETKENNLISHGKSFIDSKVFMLKTDEIKIYLIPEDEENSINDWNKLYIYCKGVNSNNFSSKIERIITVLNSSGITLKIEKFIGKNIFINEIGYPQSYIEEIYDKKNRNKVYEGLYLTHFIFPGKVGFGKNKKVKIELILRILEQDYLSSFRNRLYSFSGRKGAPWYQLMGNDDKIFLSYGSGLHCFDENTFMFIFSNKLLFLKNVEFLNKMDATYLYDEKYDLLSELWKSSDYILGNTTKYNEIKENIVKFNKKNNLDKLSGRLNFIKKLNKFYTDGRILFKKNINSDYCDCHEKTYNEIRIPDTLFINKFAECMVVPYNLYFTILNLYQYKIKRKYIAGLPVEDFFIQCFNKKQFLENGEFSNYNYQLTYLEYLLRESKRYEFLAIQKARKLNDKNSILRILENINKNKSLLKKIISSKELKNSRKLREKLRKYCNKNMKKYKKLLKKYEWWKLPSPELIKKAEAISPLTNERLEKIFSEIKISIKKKLKIEINIKKIIFPKNKYLTYVTYDNDVIYLNRDFISFIRWKCGIDGVYNLITQEILSHYVNKYEIFQKTSLILNYLNKKIKFIDLAKAMNISRDRLEKLKMILKNM